MRNGIRNLGLIGLVCMVVAGASGMASAAVSKNTSSKANGNSIVITFKDGHQQAFPLADVARIEFKTPAVAAAEAPASKSNLVGVPGRGKFVGKWVVGTGNGNATFDIMLEENGQAHSSRDSGHGTWVYVDGEVRVSWHNGWHDVIRKVGTQYQKFAYAPDKSYSDNPANVTAASKVDPEPI